MKVHDLKPAEGAHKSGKRLAVASVARAARPPAAAPRARRLVARCVSDSRVVSCLSPSACQSCRASTTRSASSTRQSTSTPSRSSGLDEVDSRRRCSPTASCARVRSSRCSDVASSVASVTVKVHAVVEDRPKRPSRCRRNVEKLRCHSSTAVRRRKGNQFVNATVECARLVAVIGYRPCTSISESLDASVRIGNIFKVADLRNKVLFTVFVLAMYRFGVLSRSRASTRTRSSSDQQAGSRGRRPCLPAACSPVERSTQFALFALGIMPYITASIIMQILAVVIPKLRAMAGAGCGGPAQDHPVDPLPDDRHRDPAGHRPGVHLPQRWWQVFGRPAEPAGIDLVPDFSPVRVLLIMLTFTAGTALLMWMGELITQRGIGNGMSLIIFASVVSQPAERLHAI